MYVLLTDSFSSLSSLLFFYFQNITFNSCIAGHMIEKRIILWAKFKHNWATFGTWHFCLICDRLETEMSWSDLSSLTYYLRSLLQVSLHRGHWLATEQLACTDVNTLQIQKWYYRRQWLVGQVTIPLCLCLSLSLHLSVCLSLSLSVMQLTCHLWQPVTVDGRWKTVVSWKCTNIHLGLIIIECSAVSTVTRLGLMCNLSSHKTY